jgi:hypothetical protein
MVSSPELTFYFCLTGLAGPGTFDAFQQAFHPDSATRAAGAGLVFPGDVRVQPLPTLHPY